MKHTFEIEDFLAFKVRNMWTYFKSEHFSFWMICSYLFFEFVRPQALFPQIDILPFAQLFLLGSLIGAIVDPSVRWTSSPTNKWIILFFIWIELSTYTAYDRDVSIKHFMDFFGWFVIYFLVINIINTPERFYVFISIYIIAAGKIAVGSAKSWAMRGFSYAGWGLMGPTGYFQNSGELAVLMVMLFPLTYYMFALLKTSIRPWERILLIALWVAPILTILGASSRGSQIALAGQLLFMFRKSLFKIRPLIGVSCLITILILLLPQEQKDRFNKTGDDKTSMQRILYWKHGYTMIQEHPFLGVGYFNFATYFENHFPGDLLYPHAELPHNIFIQIGTDAGIPAIFFFTAMLAFCIYTPFRCKYNPPVLREVGFGLGMGVFGFFIAGQFVTITYYPFFWIHLAMLVSLRNINLKISTKNATLNLNNSISDQK